MKTIKIKYPIKKNRKLFAKFSIEEFKDSDKKRLKKWSKLIKAEMPNIMNKFYSGLKFDILMTHLGKK